MRRNLLSILVILLVLTAFVSVAVAVADVLSIPAKKGTVTFNHAAHEIRAGKNCQTCHHEIKIDKSGKAEKVEKGCRDCHKASAVEGNRFSQKEAFHQTCKGCHKKNKKGPLKCFGCHAKPKK